MTEDNTVWHNVRTLLQQIEAKILSTLPTEGVTVTPADTVAVGMYWRCMSVFGSIILLLNNNHAEEAIMLGRSLFTDSLRLRELDHAGADRQAIQLGYYANSLERTRQRLLAAKRLGVTEDITQELSHVEKQKSNIEGYRKQLGIKKLKQFSSEENLINRLNLEVDHWTFLFSHGFVHGEDVAQTFRRRRIQSKTYAFFSHTADPVLLAGVGLAAARSIIDAHEAVANMFGMQNPAELQELLEEIKASLGKS